MKRERKEEGGGGWEMRRGAVEEGGRILTVLTAAEALRLHDT